MGRITPPCGVLSSQGYRIRFAQGLEDVRAIQRLRFEVFNLELREGLASAYALGRDEDAFDHVCHHLLVEDPAGTVVGTYRMLSPSMLDAGSPGLYSSTEFDLSAIPAGVLSDSVEVGRACVADTHRSGRVIAMLWRGLAHYMTWSGKRFLFGCCSIPATTREAGHHLYQALLDRPAVFSDTVTVTPLPQLDCRAAAVASGVHSTIPIPSLFEGYLRLGARVCGPPALDESFGTVDFFVLLDLHNLAPRAERFFRTACWVEQ